jgi:hypothetical protein
MRLYRGRIKFADDAAIWGLHQPIHANIVGSPNAATSIRASIAAPPLWRSILGFRKFGNVIAGALERYKLAPARQ